jgi:hypothetical protein
MDPRAAAAPEPAPIPAPLPLAAPAFSVGGVIGRAFSTWSRNLVPFAVVAGLVNLPAYVIGVWNDYQVYGGYPSFSQVMERAREHGAGPFADFAQGEAARAITSPLVMASGVVTMLLWLVAAAALTSGSIQFLAGRRPSVGALLRVGLGRAIPVFVAGLLAGLLAVVGSVLLLVPGIIAFCATSVAIPAVVAESRGPIDAIRRSFRLTRGRRSSIALAFLVMGIVDWPVSAVVGLLPMVMGGGMPSAVAGLVAFVVGAIVAPLWILLPAVAYHDLRVAKEGVATAELARVFE